MAITLLLLLISISCVQAQAPEPIPNPVNVPMMSTDKFGFVQIEEISSGLIEREELDRLIEEAGLEGLAGETFEYRVGEATVTLRYYSTLNVSETTKLVAQYPDYVPPYTVVVSDTGVYEIESDDPFAAEVIRDSLDIPTLQKIKLTPYSIMGECVLFKDSTVHEGYAVSEELDLGFPLESVLRQHIIFYLPYILGCDITYFLPEPDVDTFEALEILASDKETDFGLYVLDDVIIDIDTDNIEVAEKIWRLLNIPPPSRYAVNRFSVSFGVVPVERFDHLTLRDWGYSTWFDTDENLLLEKDPTIEFGRDLQLYLAGGYSSVESNPPLELTEIDDSLAVGHLSEPGKNLLSVELEAVVETGRPITAPPQELIPYVDLTDRWPVDSPAVRSAYEDALVNYIGGGAYYIAVRLHTWVRENVPVQPDYLHQGRVSVEEALETGEGDEWTRSDVFITLARAAGLQTRQLAGFKYQPSVVDNNIVWAQVWVQDTGVWLDVDCERETVGIDSYYIPIWGSRDGNLAYLYSVFPTIERSPGRRFN